VTSAGDRMSKIQATHGTLTLNEIARCDQAAPCAPSGCKAPPSGSLTNGALRDRTWMEGDVNQLAHPVH